MKAARRDPRATVMAGLVLAYVWRFHILAPGMEALRISALLTLASWGFLLVSPQPRELGRTLRQPFVWLYLGVLAWAFLGFPFGLHPPSTFAVLKDVHFRNVIFLLFLLSTITTYLRLEIALMANAVGAAVLAFYYIKAGTPTMWTPVSTYDRNDLALLFNMTLPLALWLMVEQRTRLARIFSGLLAGALGFCVMMSQSRGGFLGLGVILLYLMITEKTVPLRLRLAPLVVLAVGLLLLPAEAKERLSTLTSLEQDYNVSSATGRVEIWKRGLGYAQDRPMFGVGLGNFPLAEGLLSDESRIFGSRWKASVAHNSYLEMIAETGFPGGAMYLGVILALLMCLFRWRKRLKGVRRRSHRLQSLFRLVNTMTASVLGFAFGSFFLSTFNLSLLVLIIALTGAMLNVASKTMAAESRSASAPRRRRGKTLARPSESAAPVLIHR
ncbi:O-antigen ligase family protein [Gemmatimonadota bacterium DH-20]|uniref:O-antigen ligase family protein n=1 Tax=Gaopeijia maritima TaxID=3119007 RepID=A0ABU9E405_9BACT